MCDPASSMRTFMPAFANSRAAQPPHAPEPTMIASNDMMLRVRTSGELQVVRVAFVVERFDHARACGVEGERVFLLNEMVSEIRGMARRVIALRFRHGFHQRLAALCIRGMKSSLF